MAAYPAYHHGRPVAQPTCWLAAAQLPATPPNACRPYVPRADALHIGAGVHTPALSHGGSSSSSSSSSRSSLSAGAHGLDDLGPWHPLALHASPERVHPGYFAGLSPARVLGRRPALVQADAYAPKVVSTVELAAREAAQYDFSQLRQSIAAAATAAAATAHPRIVRAPTDRRPGFVEGLVDVTEIALTSIWSGDAVSAPVVAADGTNLPLRWFIKETLRRSRTSCSTLQLALFYLHRSRASVRDRLAGRAYPSPPASPVDAVPSLPSSAARDPVLCGRRMLLAALVCASKFLQDRNYSSRAWSKISGLPVAEINANERALLQVLGYELFVRADVFANWTHRLEALATDYARQHGIDYEKRQADDEQDARMAQPSPPRSPAVALAPSSSVSAPALRQPLPTPPSLASSSSCAAESAASGAAATLERRDAVVAGWLAGVHPAAAAAAH